MVKSMSASGPKGDLPVRPIFSAAMRPVDVEERSRAVDAGVVFEGANPGAVFELGLTPLFLSPSPDGPGRFSAPPWP